MQKKKRKLWVGVKYARRDTFEQGVIFARVEKCFNLFILSLILIF